MDFQVKAAGSLLDGETAAPFPFVLAGGDAALAVVTELRGRARDVVPVIFGDEGQAARLVDELGDGDQRSVDEIIAAAKRESVDRLFDAYETATAEHLRKFYEQRGVPVPELVHEVPHGDWPEQGAPQQVPLSLFDIGSHKPKDRIVIGLVPVPQNWHVLAHLKFGAWNECPPPDLHAAVSREWGELFGARVISVLPDVVEFEVAEPIADREEAMRVALQHFRYCHDAVYQGSQTIEALAASLVGARYWCFWWD